MKRFIFFLILSIFFIPNVNAYVNGGLYENLSMPSTGAFIGFSGNTGSALGTSYQADSTDYGTLNQRIYYYLTDPTLYNDIYGTAFRFILPTNISSKDIIDMTTVFCSNNTNAWYGTGDNVSIFVGSSSNATNGNYYITPEVARNEVIYTQYLTDSTTFRRCIVFKTNFTANNSGQYFSIRIKSSSTIEMGQLSFMGFTLIKNGVSYASDFNALQNSIDEINDNLKDIDDTINDSNIDNPNFEEFEQYIAENGVITQLITLPVQLYTQILNNINTTCTPFNLGQMFGHNLTMDCINPNDFFGSGLWNTIDILGTGLFIYVISKKMVAVFQQFTNLEEGDILD